MRYLTPNEQRIMDRALHRSMRIIDMPTIEQFERGFSRVEAVALARRILANVSDNYTEDQLNDIGQRARHWVMKAYREAQPRSFEPTPAERHEELYPPELQPGEQRE